MPLQKRRKRPSAKTVEALVGDQQSTHDSLLRVLAIAVVAYAFLAGLRTVADPDLGWQMATGRWIVAHRQLPSTDVLSYTAQGQPWIYPGGSQLLLYGAHAVGGFALLSFLGAVVCALTVWLVLRPAAIAGVAIAALAIPLVADRTVPRAEMFTVLLFAAFLTVLWQQHATGRAPIWCLPLLMVAWVNLHLGFPAGLALIAAYVGIEVLEMLWPERRHGAIERLRSGYLWFVCAIAGVLVNPWGWGIFRALSRQQLAMKEHAYWIEEWAPLRLNWTAIESSVSLRGATGDAYILLAIAIPAFCIAVWRRRIGAALLIAGAAWLGARHLRFEALFAVVMVVVAGAVIEQAMPRLLNFLPRSQRSIGVRVLVALIALLVLLRATALVSGHDYLGMEDPVAFGVGLSPSFPVGGARFLSNVDVGGNVFNTYNEGGFVTWQIGPKYPDFVDGRAIPFGPEIITRADLLTKLPPDAPEWRSEIARYNINAVILPLARYDVIEYFPALEPFCHSESWKPVYLDEASAVFVRQGEATADLIKRSHVDCATVRIPANPPSGEGREAFDAWANAAAVLRSLGRTSEASAANQRALTLFPTSAFARWNQGVLYEEEGNVSAAEEQYRLAAQYDPSSALVWADLAYLYERQRKLSDAIDSWRKAAALSRNPWKALLPLGYVYLEAHRPQDAQSAFNDLLGSLPPDPSSVLPPVMVARILRGRAAVAGALGDAATARSLEEQAFHLSPGAAADWNQLAEIYASYGKANDAGRAEQRARELAGTNQPSAVH